MCGGRLCRRRRRRVRHPPVVDINAVVFMLHRWRRVCVPRHVVTRLGIIASSVGRRRRDGVVGEVRPASTMRRRGACHSDAFTPPDGGFCLLQNQHCGLWSHMVVFMTMGCISPSDAASIISTNHFQEPRFGLHDNVFRKLFGYIKYPNARQSLGFKN